VPKLQDVQLTSNVFTSLLVFDFTLSKIIEVSFRTKAQSGIQEWVLIKPVWNHLTKKVLHWPSDFQNQNKKLWKMKRAKQDHVVDQQLQVLSEGLCICSPWVCLHPSSSHVDKFHCRVLLDSQSSVHTEEIKSICGGKRDGLHLNFHYMILVPSCLSSVHPLSVTKMLFLCRLNLAKVDIGWARRLSWMSSFLMPFMTTLHLNFRGKACQRD
jgi:hypothetical protein